MKHLIRSLVVAVAFLGAIDTRSEQVVVSEIMYHPPGTLPEYIEVYNNTATPFDMAQWKVRGAVDYDFPPFAAGDPTRTFLKPFERILIAGTDAATLRAAYNVPASIRAFGPWTGALDNAGERITLLDKNGVTLCTVAYNDRGKWPPSADGAGHTLVLKNPDRRIDDYRNWTASSKRLGTPGSEAIAAAETPAASPEVNLNAGLPFVNYGDNWRIHDKNIDLGTAWRTPAFDDSSWTNGPGLFGFETASLPAPGIRTPFVNASQLTYYARTRFVYNGTLSGITISVDQILDDGAVYYLNGTEIGRSGIAAGTVTFTTTANRTTGDAAEELNVFSVPGTALVNGTNVLAVEIHQVSTTSSDVVFGARLKISAPTAPGLVINEVLPGTTGNGFVEIYNPRATNINLRNHYVTDSPANLAKFRIATDVIVPAGGLASVGFAESSLAVASPVTVYLVAPDGLTPISAVSAIMPLDGRSIGRKPTGGASWYLFVDPTRDAPNASQSTLSALIRVNEVHFSPTNTVDWVEMHNDSDAAVALDGLFVASRPDLTDKLPLTGSLGVGAFASRDVAFPVSGGEVTLYLGNATDTVFWSRVFARPASGDSQQAFPDGSDEWYAAAASSRDTANNPARQTNVVINEIMYDAPSDEPSAEFIELYNRGSNAVDLSGWRFTDGVDFTFPNGTTLAPDSYLVVAADRAALASIYGAIPAVGPFAGRLANNGELIRLVDATGNLADELHYEPGGNWPRLANGDGASMELRNPWMDNALSSAWVDSNETNKTTFQTFSYSAPFQQLRTGGAVTDYKELHLHLVGDSHIILRNIQLRSVNPASANLLVNSTRMSADSASASGWLAQGTHFATHFQGAEMHMIADGHGDNRPNRVELDATAMNAGSTYEVSFEARWVAGASRLIVQTWDHSIATTLSMPVPRNLGTPGSLNSRYIPLPAAQIDKILHSPVVPAPGQVVTVTAPVQSPVPNPQVLLYHRLDNATDSGTWLNKPMFDNGVSGGDQVAGDGIYSAQLTEYPSSGQIAQFYVVATANGQSTQLPRKGSAKPALFVVDSPIAAGDLRRMRFIVPALVIADLAGGDAATPPNGFAFPRLANHYFNMTLVINERDVIYDCEIRNGGSPWTRGGDLSRGKYKYPKDQLFRGHEKQTFDNDAAGGSRHHNRIIRHWLYLFGHPANENEYIQVKVNNGGVAIREETEPLGNDMMDRIYADGSQGELYRIDDEWWFNDDWGRGQRDANWSYFGTDNPGRYHSEWMKRTRENEYDYSSLIGLFRKVNTTYTQAEIEQIIDPVATMMMAAARGYAGDWDTFSLNRGKNGYMYRRSTDGLFMFFHWDSDLAFQSTGEVFYNGMAGYRPYHEKPYNLRLYRHFLATLVEQYTRNSPRINAWIQAEEDSSSQYTVSSAYQTWFSGREANAFSHLGASRTTAFDITSNGGATINVSSNTVNLSGTGPLRAFKVIAVGHPEAVSSWPTENTWSLTGIRLRTGVNVITINAVDYEGNVLHTDTITVNKSGNAPPVMVLDAKPNSWHVSVFDSLEIDASDSYDPDGLPLSFAWAANPNDAQLDASGGDNAEAIFPRPGLYTFTVTGTDAGAATNAIQREAAVYGPGGFSPFSDPRLESFWNRQNVTQRANHHGGPYYSANEVAGTLALQVFDDRAYPLASAAPSYPLIWRALPPLTDWAFLTEVKLNAQVFGDYITGGLIEMEEGGGVVRYAFGIEDGTLLNVRRVTAAGAGSLLRSVALTKADVAIRVRRVGNTLAFDRQVDNGSWTNVHSTGLPVGSAARKAGMFLATDTAQRIKSVFDYAILIDPSATSDLRQNLRFSEIMYNPVGGAEYEFVELVNIGNSALDLTGVRFVQGIDYTFGPATLGPRQYLVVVKNQALFASRYNASTMNVAPGIFGGRLDNSGETVSLADSNGIVFLSLNYGVTDPWPSEADGSGSSLEVKDPSANPVDPSNWRASPEANGSPGRAGGDALGTIIVNEALSHTDPPLEDAIEVFNRTGQPIDIGGWFLSDSKADFKKWRIPDNTIVPALGFRVFYEIDFNSNNPVTPFSLSSANGDQIYLSAADVAGNLTGYRSLVEFDAAANGVPFGRYETSVGRDFPALLTRTFGADNPATLTEFRTGNGLPNTAPRVGPVVINEIMYRPPDIGGTNDNSADEFVEIYNITDGPVALFDPAFPTNSWRLRGGADFNFPTNITLPPHGYALIANFNPLTNATALAAFRALYGVPASVPIFGPYQGKLNNSGEEVKLTRPDAPDLSGTNIVVPYILVDKVSYSDGYPWPASADGTGPSLQRRRPHDYGNDPVNWKAAAVTTGRANVPGADYDDADQDGMADSFETANGFSTASAADAALDADNDGKTNYEEFLDGTNPNNNASRLVAPSITTPPQAQTAAAGGTATFTVAANGTSPLSFQWRFNGVAINGGTNAALTLSNVQGSQAGEYSVVIHSAAGFAISAGATLSVSQPLTILAQPQSRIINRGGSATFTVIAAGTGPLRYQWRFGGSDIANATSASLTINDAEPPASGNYSVMVTDDNGSIISADATLSVLFPPTILAQPLSQTNVAYATVFFSVTPGGEGPFTYQWRFGAVPILDATNSILALPNVQPGQAGTYSVAVFNPVGSIVSANAILTLLLPATITQQPRSTNVNAGATVIFTVTATSSTPMTYQWRFNDADIPGATGTSLTNVNVQESQAGNYQVVVTDGIGSVSSSIAVLGITTPLFLLQPPLSQSVVEGGSVTLSAQWQGGPPPFGVEWRKLSTPIVSNTVNAAKAFFTLTNIQAADAGDYRVVIRNVTTPSGVANTLYARLTVLADFDDDGMPDVWEQTYGFNTNSAADASQDADGDTLSNRAEYQSGTDPRDPADYLWVDASASVGVTTVWFPAMPNKTYTVEFNDFLGSSLWNKLDDLVARGTNHTRAATDSNPVFQRNYRVITPRRP